MSCMNLTLLGNYTTNQNFKVTAWMEWQAIREPQRWVGVVGPGPTERELWWAFQLLLDCSGDRIHRQKPILGAEMTVLRSTAVPCYWEGLVSYSQGLVPELGNCPHYSSLVNQSHQLSPPSAAAPGAVGQTGWKGKSLTMHGSFWNCLLPVMVSDNCWRHCLIPAPSWAGTPTKHLPGPAIHHSAAGVWTWKTSTKPSWRCRSRIPLTSCWFCNN